MGLDDCSSSGKMVVQSGLVRVSHEWSVKIMDDGFRVGNNLSWLMEARVSGWLEIVE